MLGTATQLVLTSDAKFKELERLYESLKQRNVDDTSAERWERDMKMLQVGLQLEQLRITINTM